MSLLSGYALVYDLYICSSVVIMMYISQKQLNDISEEKKTSITPGEYFTTKLNWGMDFRSLWIIHFCAIRPLFI